MFSNLKISAPFSSSLYLGYAFQFENIFGEIYLLSRLVSPVLFFFASNILTVGKAFTLSLSLVIFLCAFISILPSHTQKSVKWSERKAKIILIKNVTLGGSKMMFFSFFAAHNMRHEGEKVYRILLGRRE
jgi:hypothetical protein